MSSKIVEMRTVQQYKEYAQSTQQLNEALNNEIKQCYWQIDTLRADLKKISEGSQNRDADGRLINELKLRVNDLQTRNQSRHTELINMRIHATKIENELKEEQQQNQIKSKLLQKAQDSVTAMKEMQRMTDRKIWDLQQKCKVLEAEVARQTSILSQRMDAKLPSQSRRQDQQVLEETKQKLSLNEQKIKTLQTELKRNQQDSVWLKQLVADKSALEEMLLKQISSITNERISAEKVSKQAQMALNLTRNQISELKHNLSVSKTELKQYQHKLHVEEQKARKWIEQSNELKARLTQKDQLNNRQETTIKQLEGKLTQLDVEIAQYRHISEQTKKSLSQNRSTGQQTNQLRAQIKQLSSELSAKNQAMGQFRDQIEKLSTHISKLEVMQTLPPVEEELQLAANEIASLRKQLHQLSNYKMQHLILYRIIANLREENARLKTLVTTYEQENRRSVPQSNLHRSSSNQKLSNSRLRADYTEALRKNNSLIEVNARLEIIKNQLLQDIDSLKKQRHTLSTTSQSEMSDLKARLMEAYSQMEQLSRTVINKQNSINHGNLINQSSYTTADRKWRHGTGCPKQLKHSTSEHWLTMQQKIENLRVENDMLKKNLSFGSSY